MYVNGRFLTQDTTGVQRFAEGVSLALMDLRDDVLFLTPDRPLRANSIPADRIRPIGRFNGHLWEQYDLPRFLSGLGNPLLLSLSSTGPMRYKPQISTHHDITYVRHRDSFSRRFRLAYGIIVPRVIGSSAGLITVSDFSRDEISRHFGTEPDSFLVVPNAVDSRFIAGAAAASIESPSAEAPHYLLAVSSPNAHKNFDRLLRAFSSLHESYPQLELRVVGSQARSFSDQSGVKIPPNAHFIGRVDDDELIRLYQGALAFVFPSLYEGFGIPPLEAQACGCPVVASRAASIPEVLGDSALYFDPLDEADMADVMRQVVDSPDLRRSLRIRGQRNVARYSWERSATMVSELITQVSGEAGRVP